MKVLTLVGTRPEIIRLSETIKELDKITNHVLVHTGQNYDYELNEIFFKELELRKPDYYLDATKDNAIATIGNILEKIHNVLIKEKPDAFLVLGDTNSCLGAYAAKRLKIPIFHMEAGNRCFDQRVPEEINRKIIDHLSDINLVYSELSRIHLINEGFPINRIIKTGSPMLEVLLTHRIKIENSSILTTLNIKPHSYFVFSSHREENIDSPDGFKKIIHILKVLTERYNLPIILSMHPRTQKKLETTALELPANVRPMKPFGFFDYVHLQQNAFCTISDSGTINEESSILNFPAVNLRESHERPEAMDEATTLLSGLDPNRVLQCVELATAQGRNEKRDFRLVSDYDVLNVSKKVARLIISYRDVIMRSVWLEK